MPIAAFEESLRCTCRPRRMRGHCCAEPQKSSALEFGGQMTRMRVVAFAWCFLTALAPSVDAAGLANGEQCSAHRPTSAAETIAAHQSCASSHCMPGPSDGSDTAWYCAPASAECSFPKSTQGATDYKGGAPQVCINHVAYACMFTGSGTKHFAPTGKTRDQCNIPDKVVHGTPTCSGTGNACGFVGRFCDTSGNGNVCQDHTTLYHFPQLLEQIP